MGADDFIMIGPAAPLQAAGSIDSLRVAGMAVGRFTLADGRPGDQPWMADEMVRAFKPDTVPILTRHASQGGLLLGYLDTLRAEGPDLHFTGTVGGHLRERIGYRGVPVSVEIQEGAYPNQGWPTPPAYASVPPLSESVPHFRGTLRSGHNLVGVALTSNPAATGSYLWIVE